MNSGKRVDGVDGVDRFSVELSRFVRLDRFQGLLCSSSNSADKDRPHPYFSLPYIAVLVTKSVRSFYALKTIRTNGLNGNALWDVTRATLVSQLLYASHAWWGYFKADERNPLQSIIVKATVRVLLPRSFSTLDELREDSPILTINCSSQPGTKHNPNHVLHRLLPQPKTIEHNLRQRVLTTSHCPWMSCQCYYETKICT